METTKFIVVKQWGQPTSKFQTYRHLDGVSDYEICDTPQEAQSIAEDWALNEKNATLGFNEETEETTNEIWHCASGYKIGEIGGSYFNFGDFEIKIIESDTKTGQKILEYENQ